MNTSRGFIILGLVGLFLSAWSGLHAQWIGGEGPCIAPFGGPCRCSYQTDIGDGNGAYYYYCKQWQLDTAFCSMSIGACDHTTSAKCYVKRHSNKMKCASDSACGTGCVEIDVQCMLLTSLCSWQPQGSD